MKYLRISSYWGSGNVVIGWKAVIYVGLAHGHGAEENNGLN